MKRLLIAGVVASLAWVPAAAMGWRGSSDSRVSAVPDEPYNAAREFSFEGTVLRIDPPPCVAMPLYSYHVHVQLEKEIVEVHLAPCWYAEDQRPPLKVGDRITGIGAEASWHSGPRRVITAKEIRRGKDVLRFRDASGKALWKQR